MSILENRVPVRPASRDAVYAIIDGERDYQSGGLGNAQRHVNAPPTLTVGENLFCIDKCLRDAQDAWYRPDGGTAALPYIRKIAALATQALENYGAPAREGFDPRIGAPEPGAAA